jgi:hypothetical protein
VNARRFKRATPISPIAIEAVNAKFNMTSIRRLGSPTVFQTLPKHRTADWPTCSPGLALGEFAPKSRLTAIWAIGPAISVERWISAGDTGGRG